MSHNGESPGDGETSGDVRAVTNPRGWQYVCKKGKVPGWPELSFISPGNLLYVQSPDGKRFMCDDEGFSGAIENFRKGFASTLSPPQEM